MTALQKFRLDGKVVLVTGGAGILGREFCAGLAELGAKVAVVDIDGKSAGAFAESLGHGAERVSPAISPRSIRHGLRGAGAGCVRKDRRASQQCRDQDGRRDANSSRRYESYPLDTWREVMSVNIDGMFLMARAVGGQMVARGGGGSIVQTSSIYGLVGPDKPNLRRLGLSRAGPINTPAVYAASKAAVVGLTRWLATYWAKQGIRVNCLVPGGVSSGQNSVFSERYSARVPMGRMAKADEMVPALLYLLSDAASYVTGQVIAVDGGLSAW